VILSHSLNIAADFSACQKFKTRRGEPHSRFTPSDYFNILDTTLNHLNNVTYESNGNREMHGTRENSETHGPQAEHLLERYAG
jgi:hypothetical protein